MKHKKYFFLSAIFFLLAYLVLYYSPGSVFKLQSLLNDSDFLEPFSVFQMVLTKGSSPDYVFGAYTPFLDLFVGLIFWIITKNIQLTFLLYAIYQPILITACLTFFVFCIVGRNWKVFSLVVLSSALPVIVFASGHLQTIYYLFGWHIHVSTIGAGLLVLGSMIVYTTQRPINRRFITPHLFVIASVTVFTVLSDPGFLSQFIAPVIATLLIMLIAKQIPFRRAAYAGLTMLYASAAGLALYQLPRMWGSDRVVMNGSVLHSSISLLKENLPYLIWHISELFAGDYFLAFVWLLFFIICIAGVWSLRSRKMAVMPGSIRPRLLIVCIFLPLQLAISILAALMTNEPFVRYYLPSIFIPLFWGWPVVLLMKPGWLRLLHQPRMVFPYVVLILACLLSIGRYAFFPRSIPLPDLTSYYPEFTACLDQNAKKLGLQRGIAQYWQARQTTLLTKEGLVVAQVNRDLTPMRYLNNSDSYRGVFDFVIIDNRVPYPGWVWIDREILLSRYGDPAVQFRCGESDIFVYNRMDDSAFHNQFSAIFQNDQ